MDQVSPLQLVRYLEDRFPGCYSSIDALRHGREWPGISEVTVLLTEQYRMDFAAAAYYAPALCACAVWVCYKRIYAFRDVLAKTLCGGEEGVPPLAFPVDPLGYLPFPGIYIQVPDILCSGIHGCFVWKQDGIDPAIHILFLHTDGRGFTPGTIRLTPGISLCDALPDPDALLYPLLMAASRGEEGALRVMLQQLPLHGPYPNVIHNLTVRAAQLLLYLVSANADIDQEPDETDTVQVGRKISEKLVQAASPRKAYIRQGHWHKYWYGPKNGERRLVPKWIPPVIVGEGKELATPLTIKKLD